MNRLVLKPNSEIRWFVRKQRPLLRAHMLSVSLIVLSSLMFLLDPLLIKWLIDRVLPQRDMRLLLLAAVGFLGIYICRLGFSALAGIVSFRTVQNLVFRIRLDIVRHMNLLSADYHETTPIGEKLYRVVQDVDQVAELGSRLVPYVLQTMFNAVFVVGTMFLLDFRLTGLLLILGLLFFLFRKYFEGRLRQASDLAQQQSSRESSFLQEHLASLIQVQLLRRERSQVRVFLERAAARTKALDVRTLAETSFRTCYMAVIALSTIVILGYGGHEVFVGALTVGGLVAFYSYLARLFDPLNAAVDIYSRVNRLSASIRRIVAIIEKTPTVAESPRAVHLDSPARGYVELREVSFSYVSGSRIVDSLGLTLEAGEKVALVGRSGSGKSTITKLIARLYDVSQGAVYIDGIDVRELRLNSLRTNVCYLMQDPVLFDRTLKDNLLLGKPSATNKELIAALEIADLHELVEGMPQGWDTPIGPKGNFLSGGERQRLALARLVLQNPSILLLDESTSALDASCEQRVFKRLVDRFADRTIVFVSHRLSSLKWVDRIVVLNGGVIQEQGTHDQLISNSGLYARLHNVSESVNFQRLHSRTSQSC